MPHLLLKIWLRSKCRDTHKHGQCRRKKNEKRRSKANWRINFRLFTRRVAHGVGRMCNAITKEMHTHTQSEINCVLYRSMAQQRKACRVVSTDAPSSSEPLTVSAAVALLHHHVNRLVFSPSFFLSFFFLLSRKSWMRYWAGLKPSLQWRNDGFKLLSLAAFFSFFFPFSRPDPTPRNTQCSHSFTAPLANEDESLSLPLLLFYVNQVNPFLFLFIYA